MEERSVLFFHTDNGGPTSHACNAPYRGGKFTFWEGGVVRVALTDVETVYVCVCVCVLASV